MSIKPERAATIREVLKTIAEYLDGLSDNEWVRSQNSALQVIVQPDIRIELKVKTAAAQRAALDAMGRSVGVSKAGKPAHRRDLAAEAAAANARQPTGIPLDNSGLRQKYPAPEVIHSQEAETRTPVGN